MNKFFVLPLPPYDIDLLEDEQKRLRSNRDPVFLF